MWALLEAADPARGVEVPPGDADALLRRAANDITPDELDLPVRARHARPRAVWPLAVGVTVAVTAVVAAGVVTLRPAHRAAGPVPGGTAAAATHCLAALADQIQSTPYDGRTGRYEFLHVTGHTGVSSEVPGKPGVMASVEYSQETWRWLTADGSGRVRTVTGAPTYRDAASRTYFTEHPDAGIKTGDHTSDVQFEVSPIPPADPAALEQALYQPRENGPSQAVVGVGDLNREHVLDKAHRAGILRFLAGTDGVDCRGDRTDPAGRTGTAVSAARGRGPKPSQGDQGTEWLLFDPRTGEVLATGTGEGSAVTWNTVILGRDYSDQPG
jgi:hypothetical protein